MSMESLREELGRRAQLEVEFTDWDAFILGKTSELAVTRLPAGEVARLEYDRWRLGRFPSIQLAVADALFSKTRKYQVVVRTCVRSFAEAFGQMPLAQFVVQPWRDVYRGVFGHVPEDVSDRSYHHLSDEARVQSTLAGSRAFESCGIGTPREFAARLAAPGGEAYLRRILSSVTGIGPALQSYALMNLGLLTLKADRHVIRVAAPYLGLSPDASPKEYESRLAALTPALGLSSFEIDQILWYTEAAIPRQDSGSEVVQHSREEAAAATIPVMAEGKDVGVEGPISGRKVVGSVVDIQPSKDQPTLELRFSKDDADCFPAQNKSRIDLTINGVHWTGTIGITGKNPPYVHTNLESRGSVRSMTDILKALGVKEKGQLEFECARRGALRLTSVVDKGEWRPGNESGARSLW
jgi:hypothetical protein